MSLQIQKNDKRAYWLIGIFSVIVFAAVVFLSRFTIDIDLGFDKHVFAKINAVLNSMVSLLLVLALMAIKQKNIAIRCIGKQAVFGHQNIITVPS